MNIEVGQDYHYQPVASKPPYKVRVLAVSETGIPFTARIRLEDGDEMVIEQKDLHPITEGLDSSFQELSPDEWVAYSQAIARIVETAKADAHKRPKLTTLLEEWAELVLAARGKHPDPVSLEVEQIGGIAINLLWQILMYGDDRVNNIARRK